MNFTEVLLFVLARKLRNATVGLTSWLDLIGLRKTSLIVVGVGEGAEFETSG